MNFTRLSLTAALAALSAVFAPGARAEDDGEDFGVEERVEVRERRRHGDHDRRGGGERDRGQDRRRDGERDGGRPGGPEQRGGSDGGDGPRGMRERDPEMREKLDALRRIERKSRELAARARAGSDADKAAAKAELRKTLGELYDARLAVEAAELAKLEKHASELKAKIAKKKSARDKAIESRLSHMTGEGDDW